MGWFSRASEPPLCEDGALAYVLWVARECHGIEKAQPDMAIDHDLGIFGDDVCDFAQKLADRYGDWVWQWPWDRFASLNEPHIFSAPLFIWRLITFPFRGKLFDESPYECLTLGHIAFVLERGEWFDP